MDELFAAIDAGHGGRVAALLDAHPARAATRNAEGETALLHAVYRRDAGLVDLLRRAHPGLDAWEAAAVGDVGRLRELLDADPAAVGAYAPDGFHPLALAAFFGRAEAVALLLERGADPAQAARNAQLRVNALHAAAAANETGIAERLLDAGAPVDAAQPGGFTALHAAAAGGNDTLAALLLARGADPGARLDDGRTAADLAAEAGHEGLAGRLRAA